MNFLRTFEVASGIAAFVLAIIINVMLLTPPYDSDQLLGGLMFFVGPSLLMVVGSYLHATRESKPGFVILMVGSGFLTIMLFVHTFGGVFYYGLWKGLAVLSPSAMAILNLIAAVLVKSRTHNAASS